MYNRAYKYRLYPNKSQEDLLQKHFDQCRFIYNHFLEVKIKYYKETKKTINWQNLVTQLPILKEEFPWLNETGSQSLQQSIINLDRAYIAFFRSSSGFPKFKSKHKSKKSFIVPLTNGNIKLKYGLKRFVIPKFGDGIKCIFDREIPINYLIKKATISQDKDKKYYVSVLVEVNEELPQKSTPIKNKSVGIDFGVKTFLTLSNGTKIENPKYFKQSQDKLKKHQQELELLEKNTTKYKSKKEQITKLHSKISRQRKDFLDKLSYKLTHDNQVDTICIEDLSIKTMQQNNFSSTNRIISDCGWSIFVNMLQYKSDWYGKNFNKIGRFEPSSKACNECGLINHKLTLGDREWECECGIKHDRDINAAKNILDFSFPETFFKKGRNYPIETLSFR